MNLVRIVHLYPYANYAPHTLVSKLPSRIIAGFQKYPAACHHSRTTSHTAMCSQVLTTYTVHIITYTLKIYVVNSLWLAVKSYPVLIFNCSRYLLLQLRKFQTFSSNRLALCLSIQYASLIPLGTSITSLRWSYHASWELTKAYSPTMSRESYPSLSSYLIESFGHGIIYLVAALFLYFVCALFYLAFTACAQLRTQNFARTFLRCSRFTTLHTSQSTCPSCLSDCFLSTSCLFPALHSLRVSHIASPFC